MSRTHIERSLEYWSFMATKMEEGLQTEQDAARVERGALLDAKRFMDEVLRGSDMTGSTNDIASFFSAVEAMNPGRRDTHVTGATEKNLRAIHVTIEKMLRRRAVTIEERRCARIFFTNLEQLINATRPDIPF